LELGVGSGHGPRQPSLTRRHGTHYGPWLTVGADMEHIMDLG
jgi:hypothetical protein